MNSHSENEKIIEDSSSADENEKIIHDAPNDLMLLNPDFPDEGNNHDIHNSIAIPFIDWNDGNKIENKNTKKKEKNEEKKQNKNDDKEKNLNKNDSINSE